MPCLYDGDISIEYVRGKFQSYESDLGAGEEKILADIEGPERGPGGLNDIDDRLASTLLEFLRRICVSGDARQTAARFVALMIRLAPSVIDLNLSQAARQLERTRASMSSISKRVGLEFDLGHARWQKKVGACLSYRRASARSLALGRHSSFVRRDRKAALSRPLS